MFTKHIFMSLRHIPTPKVSGVLRHKLIKVHVNITKKQTQVKTRNTNNVIKRFKKHPPSKSTNPAHKPTQKTKKKEKRADSEGSRGVEHGSQIDIIKTHLSLIIIG